MACRDRKCLVRNMLCNSLQQSIAKPHFPKRDWTPGPSCRWERHWWGPGGARGRGRRRGKGEGEGLGGGLRLPPNPPPPPPPPGGVSSFTINFRQNTGLCYGTTHSTFYTDVWSFMACNKSIGTLATVQELFHCSWRSVAHFSSANIAIFLLVQNHVL